MVLGSFPFRASTERAWECIIEKQGYYAGEAAGGYFEYAVFSEKNYYQPDRNAPVLFHLRKKGNGEQLSMEHIWTTIPADGTPVRFDLLHGETTLPNGRSHEGRKSPDGQLEIAAVTNTEEYPPGIFDWHAKISVPDGGLVEHDQEFPFEAPEAGYQESVEFNMPSNAPGWKRDALKNYFIRFGDPPKYGRIHVELDGASQHVSLDYWVNPNGSRNLEPSDPKGSSPR